jgi:hypothetical protein
MLSYDKMAKAFNSNTDASSAIDQAEGAVLDAHEEGEVFKKQDGAVDFRTVGWPMASVIFLKRLVPNSEIDYRIF